MIIYHQTPDQHGKMFFCAFVNDIVYIPFSPDEEYVKRRVKYFEEKLKDPEYNIKEDCFNLLR